MNSMNKNVDLKRDSSITVLHVLGMFMILLCHIFQEAGIYFLGEIFIIGVHLFLFVSGYLSGLKKISNPINWLKRKAIRILIPYYLFIIILFCIYEITAVEDVSLFQWVFCLLNLQGFNYTCWGFEAYGAVGGVGHLWFLTTIMLCYLITPFLDKFKEVLFSKKRIFVFVITSFVLVLILMYCGLQLSYVMIYIFGYFACVNKELYKNKYYLLISVGMLVCTILRFLFRSKLDATNFYDRYYVHVSSLAIAAWIFYTVRLFSDKMRVIFNKIAGSRIMSFLEKISFYVYIVHYPFLRGPFSISNVIDNIFISSFIAVICSVSVGTLLWCLTEKVMFKLFDKRGSFC